MPSVFITDFKFGLDRRRPRVAGVPGTLWDAKNVQISRGGDIERPKRFVPTYSLPAGQTFGLGGANGQLYTFGSLAPALVAVPLGIQYQQLAAPSGAAMTQVLDAKTVAGNLYVIARYSDGNTFHFYNGARVTDWDALADANTSFNILAIYLAELISADPSVSAVAVGAAINITARVPGTAFTITKNTVDFGGSGDQDITLTTAQANVATVTETRASTAVVVLSGTTGGVTDITVNAVSLLRAAVPWAGSTTATAALIATQINDKSAAHGYTAVAVGATITITAAIGTGATPNEYAVAATVTGDVLLSTPSMAGGITAVAGVAQITTATLIGTFQSADQFIIIINGVTYTSTGRAAGTGVSGYVFKRRILSVAGSLWEYCAINGFADWHTSGAAAGTGFLNISNETEGSERLIGAGTFIGQSAVFSRRNVRIYTMDTDASKIVLAQSIDNTGALATRAILQYGTTDTFYLDETGVRSLRARDASGAAFVNDLGVAIDSFIRAHIDTLSSATVQRACAVVEPRDGRFWLALGNRIYVLSYFPGSQISAWTYFEPGFSVSDFARIYNQLFVRADDTVYLYGGPNGQTYPLANEMVCEVDLPFVAQSPPASAMLVGFDIACAGDWDVDVITDPNDETQFQHIGLVNGITYGDTDIAVPGRASHMALRLTCASAGQATISNLTIHDDGKEPAA